jgi:hypothetical protein
MTEIQLCFGGRPILSEDKFIFTRTITSKICEKQRATAVHTRGLKVIIITSEMIFIIFSANFFQAILKNKMDPMPLRTSP